MGLIIICPENAKIIAYGVGRWSSIWFKVLQYLNNWAGGNNHPLICLFNETRVPQISNDALPGQTMENVKRMDTF